MNINVMIVDDEVAAREMLVRYLTMNGMKAVAAAGGKQCLEHFKNGFNGVVLMDVLMPGMDGWQTIKEIIKRMPTKRSSSCLLPIKTPGMTI